MLNENYFAHNPDFNLEIRPMKGLLNPMLCIKPGR